jgi:hypothetical protein
MEERKEKRKDIHHSPIDPNANSWEKGEIVTLQTNYSKMRYLSPLSSPQIKNIMKKEEKVKSKTQAVYKILNQKISIFGQFLFLFFHFSLLIFIYCRGK